MLSRTSRRIVWIAALTVAAVVVGWTVAQPPTRHSTSAGPGPLTLVGSFDGSTLAADGWRVTGGRASAATVGGDHAYSGRGGLLLDTRSSGAGATVSRAGLPVTGGLRYDVAAFARPVTGRQSLVVVFEDVAGKPVARAATPTRTSGVWSRVSTHVLVPKSATHATAMVEAEDASSAVAWDEIRLLSSTVPNGDFEAAGGSSAPPGWTVRADSREDARTVSTSHSGQRGVEISGAASSATSSRIPVFPDVSHRFAGWVQQISGQARARVDWYDADGAVVRSTSRVFSAPHGEWSRFAIDASAPDAATSATLSLTGTGTSRPVGRWDDVTVLPATPPRPTSYTTETVAALDGFLTTTTSDVVDVDGRPQLMTVVSGEPATFQVVDVQTGALIHRSDLAGLTNGWALTTSSDGSSAYVGGGDGHVLRYDTLNRKMSDLGRATPDATLIWDLQTDADGIVWGASYPRAELWSLDPATGRFSLRSRVGPATGYARGLAADDQHVFVGTGPTRPHIVMLPLAGGGPAEVIAPPSQIKTGFVKQLDRRGRFLFAWFTGDVYGMYDLTTRTWTNLGGPSAAWRRQVPSAAPAGASFYYVSDGRIWKVAGSGSGSTTATPVASTTLPRPRNSLVVATTIGGERGAWLITHDGGRRVSATKLSALGKTSPATAVPLAPHQDFNLRLEPSALHIKSLAAGNDGLIYVGGFGGPSFAAFSPDGKARLRYPSIADQSSRLFGELEGMIASGDLLYLGSYTGARLLRYDTSSPWAPSTNPLQVGSLGPSFHQDRPQAWAVDGSRTYFGTVPTYGVLGGAFGWIDGATSTPVSVRSPLADESVVSIAGRDGVAFVGTSRWGGLGSTPTAGNASVFAYDTTSKKVVWRSHPVAGAQAVGALVMTKGGQLWGVSGGTLFQLDTRTGERIRQLRLSTAPQPDTVTWSAAQVMERHGLLYVAARGSVVAVDPGSLAVTMVQNSGVSPNKLAVLDDAVYFPVGSMLKRALVQPGAGGVSGDQ